MARPTKKGLEYFPLDTDIDQDDKIQLIEGEFGIKGFAVVVKLFCKIYKDNGYYYQWDEKERLLFAKKLGEPGGLADEVVNRCIKWGLFNKTVFDKFKILTSSAIQDRFIKAISRRDKIEMIADFTLIDVSAYNNAVIVDINPINADNGTQSKGKNSKGNESRAFTPPSVDEVVSYFREKGYKEEVARKAHEYYDTAGWKDSEGKPVKNWKQKMISVWMKDEHKAPVHGERGVDRSRHPNWPEGYPYNDTNIYYFDNGRMDKMSTHSEKKTA